MGHDVARRGLANSRLLTVDQLDGGQPDGDVALVADANDEPAAAAITHGGEIAGQLAPLLVGVAVSLLPQVLFKDGLF